jgi:hypothetical protein
MLTQSISLFCFGVQRLDVGFGDRRLIGAS